MKTTHLLLAAIAGMTALCACSEEETLAPQPNTAELQVSATVTGTRAVIDGTQLPEGSQIGITLYDVDGSAETSSYSGYKNVPFTKNTDWQTANPIMLTPHPADAIAYFPYSADITDMTAIPLETDSQTDYMYSSTIHGLSYLSPIADFNLNHALCAVQINLINNSYTTGRGEVTRVTVSSPGLATGAMLDATTGTLSGFTGSGDGITLPDTFTLTDQMLTIKILAIPNSTQDDLKVSLLVDRKPVRVTVPMAKPFEKGMSYVVVVRLMDEPEPFRVETRVFCHPL